MGRANLQNLGQLLREKRDDRGIREVADDIGISAPTLSRVENGRLPDLETFRKVCAWLDVNPGEVLGYKGSSRELKAPSHMVTAHLRAEKNLSPEVSGALADLIVNVRSKILDTLD